MSARVTVSDVAAPFLLDAINNHIERLERIPNRMIDEERGLQELTAAAAKIRKVVDA